MKRLIVVFLALISFCCNNKMAATKHSEKNATINANYPYTIEHPDYWREGSTANIMLALRALKAYEEGKIDESLKYFGDSIRVQFDGMDEKLSNNTLKAMLTNAWSRYKTLNFKMNDWESVISKDKSEEWVTLWYRHSWETKKGVKDSLDVVTDLQLKDGKIIRLTDYRRQLH